jgi:multidrug efflux pump subunit AcrB
VEGDQVVASFELPPGAPFETSRKVVRRLEDGAARVLAEIESEPGNDRAVEHLLASAGESLGRARGSGVLEGDGAGTGSVEVALASSQERDISAREFARLWREATGPMPDVEELTFSSELFSAGDAIDVELRGTDVTVLRDVATRLREELERRPGVRDVRDSFRSAKDELELRLRPEAEGLGLSVVDLARQVRQAFYGEEVQRIARDGEDVKVMVRYPREGRRAVGDVEGLRVRTPAGDAVPLSVVADVRMGRGPAAIRRADGARVVNVRADVDETITSAQEVLSDLRAAALPQLLQRAPGITYSLEGEQREQRESLSGLGRGFLFALLGIFALLAIPLRSYAQPLLVMSTVPLGAVGAVAGHAALGLPLSFSSVIGMVALAGIVVNDSLVLVDWANRGARAGLDARAAVLRAATTRFRAVFLTSLTTCLGLTPLLLEQSVQAQFLIPMAVSIAAGVLAATLVSLLIVPAAYLVLDDLKGVLQRRSALASHPAAEAA